MMDFLKKLFICQFFLFFYVFTVYSLCDEIFPPKSMIRMTDTLGTEPFEHIYDIIIKEKYASVSDYGEIVYLIRYWNESKQKHYLMKIYSSENDNIFTDYDIGETLILHEIYDGNDTYLCDIKKNPLSEKKTE